MTIHQLDSHRRVDSARPRITTSPGGHYVWDGARWTPAPGRRHLVGFGSMLTIVVALVLVLAASVAIAQARLDASTSYGIVSR